jgi:aspartyl-tRNA(Asn)/glutamyl-tRNA(Gln) amidotransferase subunit A
MPRLSGAPLTIARIAAETRAASALVRQVLKRSLGMDELARLPESLRAEIPLDRGPIRSRKEPRRLDGNLPTASPATWPRRASDYAAAFADRRTTPRQVAERAIAELRTLSEREPTMNVLAASDEERTLDEADASTRRYADQKPIGPLDGVPFLVKDQHDVAKLPTSLGASAYQPPAGQDATLVARLSGAGAVFLGKTVLTEWGLSPIGANARFRMPHNPFDPKRAAGGSSTGSAVGVALGLCPIATAGDGGGSIRVPASLNGIFGIKPTFGRVSRAGDGFHESVAALGPLGASSADLALFLDVVASRPDPDDPLTLDAPELRESFQKSLAADVRGMSIGIDENEWRDAAPEIQAAGQAALRALERRGVELRMVDIPLARHAAKIGYLSIGCEGLAYQRSQWLHHREALGEDLRLALAALSGITALEYLDSQRLRRGLALEVAETLRTVDAIALPCTAGSAPRYDERDEGRAFSDPDALDSLCRFAFLANLTGLPAAAAPVGSDAFGLPTGLQLVGDAWCEATLLALMSDLERQGVAQVPRPPGAIDLLG